MVRLQREIVIGVPREVVFAFLAEPERMPEWTPGVLSVRRTSTGPIGLNSTTETQVEAFGVPQTLLGRCTVFEAPNRLVVENVNTKGFSIGGVSIGKVSMTSGSELLPEGTGTRLRASLDYTLAAGFLTSLAERVVGPRMQTDFDQSLENLKRLLESRPSSG